VVPRPPEWSRNCIASFAAEDFNQGLRAYYFALAALTWFLHPTLFMLISALVVYILYQREFKSRTLYALTHANAAKTMLEVPGGDAHWNSLARSGGLPS
jgi:uncharacterized membrane protein